MNPPPGSLWPRHSSMIETTARIGATPRASSFSGTVLRVASSSASAAVPVLCTVPGNGSAAGGGSMARAVARTDPRTPRIAMPATPRTATSPKVSRARNSTRIVLTTLLPPVISGPFSSRYMPIGDRSRRPVKTRTPTVAVIPDSTARTMAAVFRGREAARKSRGNLRSTRTNMMIVRASTNSWVIPTSGAPSPKIWMVTAMPTADSSTAADSRERATHSPATPTTTTTSSTTSITLSRSSTRGGIVVPVASAHPPTPTA